MIKQRYFKQYSLKERAGESIVKGSAYSFFILGVYAIEKIFFDQTYKITDPFARQWFLNTLKFKGQIIGEQLIFEE